MIESYTVEMLRWGNDHNHSYVVGVFDNIHDAVAHGIKHQFYRGGKYEYRITKFPQDDKHFQEHSDNFFEDTINEAEFNLMVITQVDQLLGRYDE